MTMAPSDETRRRYNSTSPSCLYNNINDNNSSNVIASTSSFPQRKTVAFAVNHLPVMVSSRSSAVDSATRFTGLMNEEQPTIKNEDLRHRTHSITDLHFHRLSSMEVSQENLPDKIGSSSNADHDATATTSTNVPSTTSSDVIMQQSDISTSTRRRSARGRKPRSIPMTTTRVRYDMELVPEVERSSTFWDSIETWPPRNAAARIQNQDAEKKENRTAMDENESANSNQLIVAPSGLILPFTDDALRTSCVSAALTESTSDVQRRSSMSLFHKSVLWIPPSRKDWEDCISELTAICTSAAYRRHDPGNKKAFHPPLSREYIKDRVNIDDPLHGYQIRHSSGGWLQGFLLWTNFTTWTNFFTWDSLHPLSGLGSTCLGKVDASGSLSKELQTLPRHGDSNGGGIVFDHVAEIALLGGLGSGELLLRMALEEIRSSPNQYKYVVLQATEGSRTFYERFGFIRVGAVCRYGTHNLVPKGTAPNSISNTNGPVQGYRHWTHANESQQSLDLHGGPSYMMCLKLPSEDHGSVKKSNLMETMKQYQVFDKPVIQPLGAVKVVASVSSGLSAFTDNEHLTSKTRVSRRQKRKSTKTSDSATCQSPEHRPNNHESHLPIGKKRRKISEENFFFANSLLPSLPQAGLNPMTNSAPTGSNLRITIYPQELLPSPSSATIPAVTPREDQTWPNAEQNQSPSATHVTIPEITKRASTNTAPRLTLGRTTWTAGKNADPSPITLKKGNTIRKSRGRSGKKGVQLLKETASNSNAVDSNKLARKGNNAQQATMTSPQKQASEYILEHSLGTIFPIDKAVLCKQKVKSYPRDRVHFFNKVVRSTTKAGSDTNFYFVLHYDDGSSSTLSALSSSSSKLTLIPMRAKGLMSGKRAGRPRYQCVVLDTNANWKTDAADKYEAVSSFMVMKTPFVAQEAWDVLGD